MTAIHWPAWVACNEDRAPRPNASPAPALLVQPESPLVAHVERDGNEPEGAIGWIGDAPVYVDDGKGVKATEPETHGKPRPRVVSPEQASRELKQKCRETLLQLSSDIERHIENSVTQSQQRLLTAVYARAVGRGNAQAKRKAKADTLLDWVETVSKHFYVLAAQAKAAKSLEELDAVQFNPADFPPPTVTAQDVLLTVD